MTKSRRTQILQNMGIITLVLVSMYYINELFGTQVTLFMAALNSIVLPFGIALFISYLLSPIVRFIEKRFKIKQRYVSIAIVFLLLLVAVALFALIIGRIVYDQAGIFVDTDWSNILVQLESIVSDNPYLKDAYDYVVNFITEALAEPDTVISIDIFGIIGNIVSVVVAIVLVPVFLVFLLSEKNVIFKGILSLVPKKYQKDLQELGIRANDVTEKYFNGRFLSMFILSIFFTIVFLIFGFGLDKAIFFGFTLGFLDIIPYVGGFIGIALPVLYTFTIPDAVLFGQWAFVALIIINIVAQFIQGNILQPYIMGKEVNLHPLLVLSSFIFFGALFGITGVILAIPITGTIKTTLEYYREERNG